jgi:hypothetical protein
MLRGIYGLQRKRALCVVQNLECDRVHQRNVLRKNIKAEMKGFQTTKPFDTSELGEDGYSVGRRLVDYRQKGDGRKSSLRNMRHCFDRHIHEIKKTGWEGSSRVEMPIYIGGRFLYRNTSSLNFGNTQDATNTTKTNSKLQIYRGRSLPKIGVKSSDDFLWKTRTMHISEVQQWQQSSYVEGELERQSDILSAEPTDEELEVIEPIVCKHEPLWYELRLIKKWMDDKICREKKVAGIF